jgi:hypothetical protein
LVSSDQSILSCWVFRCLLANSKQAVMGLLLSCGDWMVVLLEGSPISTEEL